VFDEYSNAPSTKDCTHLKRSGGGGAGFAVHFTGDTTLKMKKSETLCNKENKQRFIHMRIWCIKIGIVSVLHFNPWVETSAGGL
jgi:hypothetical protein